LRSGDLVSRSFLLRLLVAWAVAGLLLYWLEPGLGATYLVASGWVAFAAAAVWALARWPPLKRTLARRRGGPKNPDSTTPPP
jgi:membrane associated rhomboid family serine protease